MQAGVADLTGDTFSEAERLAEYWSSNPGSDLSQGDRKVLELYLMDRDHDADWFAWWEWSQEEQRLAQHKRRGRKR